jgi:uncharacterized protein
MSTMITRPSAGNEAIRTRRRWVWSQSWLDVLFLHWRVPAGLLRHHVAGGLTIDEHDGAAWVSLVLFRLNVRPAWLPFAPGFANVVEINLRTYVRLGDQPGITFLSVHAHNRLAIFLARMLTPMPYRWAELNYQTQEGGFACDGTDRTTGGFRLSLRFHPGAAIGVAHQNTLDDWLLERYRLFLPDRRDRLLRAEVSHPPWEIQDVDVSRANNTAGTRFGLDLDRPADMAHFSRGVQARFGGFRKLTW